MWANLCKYLCKSKVRIRVLEHVPPHPTDSYHPWGGPYEDDKPGFILCLYGVDGIGTRFIRAEVPTGENDQKLSLLKLLMTSGCIISLVHDIKSYVDFWSIIDNICTAQFSIAAERCNKLTCKMPEPRHKAAVSQNNVHIFFVQEE